MAILVGRAWPSVIDAHNDRRDWHQKSTTLGSQMTGVGPKRPLVEPALKLTPDPKRAVNIRC